MIQPFKKGKQITTKVTAGVLGGVMAITGGVLAAKFAKNNTSDDYVAPIYEQSTDTDDEVIDLYLSEDFSINNPEEVKERASIISEILEESMPFDKIMDMIYLINGSNKGITFKEGATDTEKFKYLQELIVDMTDLLNDNISDDVNAFANSKAGEQVEVNEDQEIYSYMFISEENKEAKKIAMEVAMIINEQLDNIKNSNVDAYEEITKRFYSLYEDVQGSDYDDSLKLAIITDIQQHAGLFNLTDEMSDKIYKNQAVYSNDKGFGAVEDLDVDMDKVINDAEKNGFGNTVTPNGNSYNASDAKDAEKLAGSGSKESTTKVDDAGGKEIGTTSQVISGGEITGTEVYTAIVPVEPTTITDVKQGGELIETFVETNIPDEVEIVDGVGEIVYAGGETITYSDADVTVATYSLK